MPGASVHATTASDQGNSSGAVSRGCEKPPLKCKFAKLTRCTSSHAPWNKTPEERSKIIQDNKLCPFCLLYSAEEACYSKTYKTRPVCTEPECKEQHVKWLCDLLKGLPCSKKEQECKVNLVQGGGGGVPKDSWMDLEDAGDEIYFVNVLLGGDKDEMGSKAGADLTKTESDEEMERELDEAEVAVDLNIRRQAKKACVEVLAPEDVVMSEAEQDRVCEAMGDEPGTWAKRRREIEEMDEEGVKAEIKKTEEVIAENLLRRVKKSKSVVTAERKPKASMSRLPWMLLLLGVTSGHCGSAGGFTV
jgi:hypothetical protein